jgi:hypothetical protein
VSSLAAIFMDTNDLSDSSKIGKGIIRPDYYYIKKNGKWYEAKITDVQAALKGEKPNYQVTEVTNKEYIKNAEALKDIKGTLAPKTEDSSKIPKEEVVTSFENNTLGGTINEFVSQSYDRPSVNENYKKENSKNDTKFEPFWTNNKEKDGWTFSPITNSMISGTDSGINEFNEFRQFNRYRKKDYNFEPFQANQFMIFVSSPEIFNFSGGASAEQKFVKITEDVSKDTGFFASLKIDAEKKKSMKAMYAEFLAGFNFIENEIKKTPIFQQNEKILPILTNRALNMPTTSLNLESIPFMEGSNDTKISLPDRITESQYSGSVTLNFLEDADLSIWKLFNYWITFIDTAKYGLIRPTYLSKNKFSVGDSLYVPYVSSIYCFLLGDAGEIKYFCRYGAAFPTNIPSDLFEMTRGDVKENLEVPIEFQYNYFEEYNEEIIKDFNYLFGSTDINGNSLKTVKNLMSESLLGDFNKDGKEIAGRTKFKSHIYDSFSAVPISGKWYLRPNENYEVKSTSSNKQNLE